MITKIPPYNVIMMNSLPKYCIHRSNTIELRVGSIVVLDTAIIGCGIVNHHHHCSTHWRGRGYKCHSSAVDAGSLDTGSAIYEDIIIHNQRMTFTTTTTLLQ